MNWVYYAAAMSKYILLPVLVTFCLATTAAAQTADEKLETFFKSYLEESFQLRPFEATMLGDHRFDHLLDDISPEARQKWLDQYRRRLKQLPLEVPFDDLSRNGQIDFEILRDDLQRNIWLAENTKPFEEDPRTYGSYISDSVYSLLTQSTLPKEANIKNAIARITQIPRIVKAAQQTLRESPPSILDTAVSQNRGAIGFYEKGIFELASGTPQLEELRKATTLAVTWN